MEGLVSFLTRKSRGGYAQRDHPVSAEILRLGRATVSEVYLPDPRVPLDCAEIHMQPGGLFVQAVGPMDLRINGAPTRAAKLSVGDHVAVGPYDIEVVEPAEGQDVAVTVELMRPLGDDLSDLLSRSRTTLAETWLRKRRTSWVLFLIIGALFLALPVAANFVPGLYESWRDWPVAVDAAWDSGDISGAHKFFGTSCKNCHEKPFVQVRDAACLSCHEAIEQHAEPDRFQQASSQATNCQSCHKEHNGSEHIVLDDEKFCVNCHASLADTLSDTKLRDVGAFDNAHPDFRISVMVDHVAGKTDRVDWAQTEGPRRLAAADGGTAEIAHKAGIKENSGVKFPHDKHLTRDKGGVRHPEKGRVLMDCGDCHVTEKGGYGMLPIRQERDCAECHRMTFGEPENLRALPHGRPGEANAIVRDYYARIALEGGVKSASAPEPVRRRRVGQASQSLSEEERVVALEWAQSEAEKTLTTVFKGSLCGTCHEIVQPSGSGGNWDVRRPKVADLWLPKGKFHHASHETMACGDCHQAAASKTATDVLMPGIGTCTNCHGGQRAADKVPSTCIMCHQFHLPHRPPMKPSGKSMAGSMGRSG